MKKLIAGLLALVMLACWPAAAETVYSPTVAGLYKIESPFVRLNEQQGLKYAIIDAVQVDIALYAMNEEQTITVWIDWPTIPAAGLEGVALFDGYHLIQGQWMRTGDHALVVSWHVPDLWALYGTVGLDLIVYGNAAEVWNHEE